VFHESSHNFSEAKESSHRYYFEMYSSYSIFIFILSVANLTAAHGIITKPYPRTVGNASLTACGSAITDIIKADNTSHVEGLPEAGASDPGYNATECNLWLCKGLQFEDNINNGREYLYTERVDISVFIRIPQYVIPYP